MTQNLPTPKTSWWRNITIVKAALIALAIVVFAGTIIWLDMAETDRLWRCISQGMQYVNGACL